ncbi:MAG: hypothetical protein ACTS53_01855 [Candidatus Hodgkinia cicadicola]
MIPSFESVIKSTFDNPNLSHLCGRSIAESANPINNNLILRIYGRNNSIVTFFRSLRCHQSPPHQRQSLRKT